jgi:hypothetical protein
MDQEKQREIARKGGAASARSQTRDEQGQFGGSRSRSGTSQGGAASGGRPAGMGQGGMSQGSGGRGSSSQQGGRGGSNR